MSLAFDVVNVGVALMACLVACHFALELIDYGRGKR